MSRLRGYQQDVVNECYALWQDPNVRNIMPVLATGAGKTVIMGAIARDYDGLGVAIAHRSELVGQISTALAREGIRHDIVAPKEIIRTIVGGHMENVGRSFYDPRANWKVASVNTISRRGLDDYWSRNCGLAFQDEGHHVLAENMWGRAMGMLPNARGLFPTATPKRADRKGLGRHAHGLVDALVEGPEMRWLINNGFLTDYIVRSIEAADFHRENIKVSEATGDFNTDSMRKEVKGSRCIVGDVVGTYLKYAKGLLGVTFAADVEHATTLRDAFIKAGVPAEIVTAETPEEQRRSILARFRRRELLQLVNVDLFGEGFDLPAIQCVSMARATKSYGLYVQQFGRALRLMISSMLMAAWDTYTPEQRLAHIAASEKPVAYIFDHVGNVIDHNGPPDYRIFPWSLDADTGSKRNAGDAIPFRNCLNPMCNQPYERFYPACPHCGTEPPPPEERSSPRQVDGDLALYTHEMWKELANKIKKVDGQFFPPEGLSAAAEGAARRNHLARQEAQAALRQAMNLVLPPNKDERYNNRKFFHTFGVDTMTAKTLGCADAEELRNKIIERVTK